MLMSSTLTCHIISLNNKDEKQNRLMEHQLLLQLKVIYSVRYIFSIFDKWYTFDLKPLLEFFFLYYTSFLPLFFINTVPPLSPNLALICIYLFFNYLLFVRYSCLEVLSTEVVLGWERQQQGHI